MPGCYGSSMFRAFSQHVLHRLHIQQDGPLVRSMFLYKLFIIYLSLVIDASLLISRSNHVSASTAVSLWWPDRACERSITLAVPLWQAWKYGSFIGCLWNASILELVKVFFGSSLKSMAASCINYILYDWSGVVLDCKIVREGPPSLCNDWQGIYYTYIHLAYLCYNGNVEAVHVR